MSQVAAPFVNLVGPHFMMALDTGGDLGDHPDQPPIQQSVLIGHCLVQNSVSN